MGLHDKSLDGDNLTERQGQALDLAKIAAKEIRKCNNTEPTTYDVFYNVIRLMKLAKMFADNPEMSVLELRPACSILTKVFRENECSLGHIKKLSDQPEEYFKPLNNTDKDIWTEALRYEKCLIDANFCFAQIEDHSEDLIDRLQNTFCEKEIAFFLSRLQSEVKKLMSTTENKAARQATAYVNLCCKIAILHSFVLWQAFCIMNRSVLFQSSTKVVLAMINRSQNSNLNMLKCFTEPEILNAVFLSVFNITENENAKHFLQIQEIETHLDQRFYEQTYKIQWVHSPDVHLRGTFTDSFCGSTKHIDEFQFQCVEGREFDNVCYIMNVSWHIHPISKVSWPIYHYIGIADDGACRKCINKSSTFKVKWKLISFGKDEFIVASADWPDRFLYLSSARECVRCKENRKIHAKKIGKGLWKFLEVE